ncbi:MAG: leucyl aminopeptidase, partial [Calditrichaceae bacterium]
IANKDFEGEYKQTSLIYNQTEIKRILLVGLGKEDEIDSEKLRSAGFLIGKKQRELKSGLVHIAPAMQIDKEADIIIPVAEGVLYSKYDFTKFKTDKKDKNKRASYHFFGIHLQDRDAVNYELKRIETMHEGITLTRDLGNMPSNYLTPVILKNNVQNEFNNSRSVKIEVLDKKELAALKFRLLLSVSQGSKQDPCLIILRYKPASAKGKKIVLVGKGVTFDSGGISIKPPASMDEMKFDMAGAAAVIGIMKSVEKLKPQNEIIGVIPAVENMPGGNAVKPGDIIKAYNGKTVEILNTDAEGRLILADALSYAVKRFKPDIVIDFATLTGSIVAALGDKMAGIFSNSSELVNIFKEAGDSCGDRVWPMPMLDAYSKDLESKYADIVNLGGRWGGAITAAKFLENFVSETDWVHIDIAGTANDVKNIDYLPNGATGYGPRLFFRVLPALQNKK